MSVFLEIKSKYLHSIFSSIVLKRYAYGANTTKLSTGLVIPAFPTHRKTRHQNGKNFLSRSFGVSYLQPASLYWISNLAVNI